MHQTWIKVFGQVGPNCPVVFRRGCYVAGNTFGRTGQQMEWRNRQHYRWEAAQKKNANTTFICFVGTVRAQMFDLGVKSHAPWTLLVVLHQLHFASFSEWMALFSRVVYHYLLKLYESCFRCLIFALKASSELFPKRKSSQMGIPTGAVQLWPFCRCRCAWPVCMWPEVVSFTDFICQACFVFQSGNKSIKSPRDPREMSHFFIP